MPRPSRRDALLDAALAVIRRDGAQNLTLDAVAAAAGVSKGGLLYHFGAKRDLVDGLVARWLDEFEARLEDGGWTPRAYVRACDLGAAPDVRSSELGVLAALIAEPAVRDAIRARHDRWMERLLEGVADPAEAWVVRLAADGLWYSGLLGLAPPEGAARARVMARLLALAGAASR
jgi:AcrR family transcriptional regulator